MRQIISSLVCALERRQPPLSLNCFFVGIPKSWFLYFPLLFPSRFFSQFPSSFPTLDYSRVVQLATQSPKAATVVSSDNVRVVRSLGWPRGLPPRASLPPPWRNPQSARARPPLQRDAGSRFLHPIWSKYWLSNFYVQISRSLRDGKDQSFVSEFVVLNIYLNAGASFVGPPPRRPFYRRPLGGSRPDPSGLKKKPATHPPPPRARSQPWGSAHRLPEDDNMDFSAAYAGGTRLERVHLL